MTGQQAKEYLNNLTDEQLKNEIGFFNTDDEKIEVFCIDLTYIPENNEYYINVNMDV